MDPLQQAREVLAKYDAGHITRLPSQVEVFANHLRAALAEVARLRERLEMGFAFDADGHRVEMDVPDGIACRDETIKLLEQKVDRLTAEREREQIECLRQIEAVQEKLDRLEEQRNRITRLVR